MIIYLKKYFPLLFKILKFLYKSNPIFKKRVEAEKLMRQETNRLRVEKENQIIRDVFDNKYVVQNGPFKGLKYINRSSGSALLPKILGSYEEPIQEWIEKVISEKKYDQILDIGCAEGYYACGFAMKLPDVKIVAYDIDEQARINTGELAKLNDLLNIEVYSECTHIELNVRSKENTLVFCDIEGFEDYLLDPVKVPNLKFSDLIVETHDCFIPGITDRLIERFLNTHKMTIIIDYPFRLNFCSTPNDVTNKQMEEISDEKRPKAMRFVFLESIYE